MTELDDFDIISLKLIVETEKLRREVSRLSSKINSALFKDKYQKGLIPKSVLGPDMSKYRARKAEFHHGNFEITFD